MNEFIIGWNDLATAVHTTAVEKGWWDKPQEYSDILSLILKNTAQLPETEAAVDWYNSITDRNDGEMICLMHSELSELLEALRDGNPPSKKIPEFSCAEEEAADLVIRLMDTAKARGWRIAEALIAKMEFNTGRPYKHGGKAF